VLFSVYSLVIGFAPGINNMAHLGGLLGGAAIGLALGRVLVTPRRSPLQPIRPIDPEEYQRRRVIYAASQPVVMLAVAGLLALGYVGLQRRVGPELRWHLAMEALGEEDWDAAIADFTYIEQHDPENEYASAMLASAYTSKGDWPQAIAAYERGLARFPRNRAMAVSLAWAYMQQKQPEKALEWMQKFERGAGADPMTLTARAHALDALDRHAEALRAYEDGRAKFEDAPGLLIQQSLSHMKFGENAAALPLAQRAVAADPNDAEYTHVLARAYEANGQREQAEAAKRKAEELEREQEE
jgi:predicted Zn-dependent protease